MSSITNSTHLPFPAPESIPWICPLCGPAASSRIAPSQVFRRSGPGAELGNSEWRKIKCTGCERKFMLRIDSVGLVTGKSIDAPGEQSTKPTIYSAADPQLGVWLNA